MFAYVREGNKVVLVEVGSDVKRARISHIPETTEKESGQVQPMLKTQFKVLK